MLSALTDEPYRRMAQDSGADVVLNKRDTVTALLPAIRGSRGRRCGRRVVRAYGRALSDDATRGRGRRELHRATSRRRSRSHPGLVRGSLPRPPLPRPSSLRTTSNGPDRGSGLRRIPDENENPRLDRRDAGWRGRVVGHRPGPYLGSSVRTLRVSSYHASPASRWTAFGGSGKPTIGPLHSVKRPLGSFSDRWDR